MSGSDDFGAVVWGDSLGDWLSAAELVLAGVRTGLLIPQATQSEAPGFPEAVFSPSSSDIIANRFGFSPWGEAENAYEPDFQVVTPQHRIDIFGDDSEFRLGLDRDVPEYAGNLNELFSELDGIGREFEVWLEHAPGYPALTWRDLWQWRLISARTMPRKFLEPFSEILGRHQVPDSLKLVMSAPLSLFSPLQAENLPAARAACLWRFLRRVSGNGNSGQDLQGALSDIISANGEVIRSMPAKAELGGRLVKSLMFYDGREIGFQALLARPGDFFSILDADQRELRVAKKIAAYFPRYAYYTLFFRIERDAVPEAMARRVIFVLSTRRELWGDNMMLLTRYRRVPRWDTLAVTLGYPKGDMEPPPADFVFESLQSLMPFLRADQLEQDETIAPKSHKFYLPRAGLAAAPGLGTPLKNLFIAFSEILPRLGPVALFLAARGLAEKLKRDRGGN